MSQGNTESSRFSNVNDIVSKKYTYNLHSWGINQFLKVKHLQEERRREISKDGPKSG